MARILSIDYGRKRTGIAVTDPLQIIANGLTTVASSQLIDFLTQYMQRESVERVVVGLYNPFCQSVQKTFSQCADRVF